MLTLQTNLTQHKVNITAGLLQITLGIDKVSSKDKGSCTVLPFEKRNYRRMHMLIHYSVVVGQESTAAK